MEGSARREVEQRIAAVARVSDAMARREWPADCASLDALAALLGAASRWQLVEELGLAA